MSQSSSPKSPNQAKKDIEQLLKYYRKEMASCLMGLDPKDPDTFSITLGIMIDKLNVSPATIAELLSTTHATVSRWASNKVLPRTPSYRAWVIETLLAEFLPLPKPKRPPTTTKSTPPRSLKK